MLRCFLMLFLLPFCSIAQSVNYEFLGVLKLNKNDKIIISYRLVFEEEKGKIKGYSVTDFGGLHETKSEIVGTYDLKNKILKFSEQEILYTKSKVNKYSFCFVHYTGTITLNKQNAKISGDFLGKFSDGTKCINGSIELVKIEKVEKQVTKLLKKLDKSKKIDEVIREKYNPVKIMDSLKMNTLTENEQLNVFVKTDKVIIKIWDVGKEDGDKIDVYVDNKSLLKDYEVKKSIKLLNVPIEKGENKLKIIAKNEGVITPNTAKVLIIDGDRSYEAYTNLKEKEEVFINFIKK